MKITPTAIRQKSFETGFRGFEKKEVSQFLEEIAEVVDQLHKENIDLKSKLQHTEMEAKRLKDVEDSLFKTLKTAEDTGVAIIEEANDAADQIISEANEIASKSTAEANRIYDSALSKAQEQADLLVGAAEKKAQDTILQLRESMGDLVRSYEGLVEQREALVKSLRRITQDSLNQMDLSEAHFSRLDAKAYKRAIEDLSRSNAFTFANLENLIPVESVPSEEEVALEEKFQEELDAATEHEEQPVHSTAEAQSQESEHTEEKFAEEDLPQKEQTAVPPAIEGLIAEETESMDNEPELPKTATDTPSPEDSSDPVEDEETPSKKDSDPSSSFFDQL